MNKRLKIALTVLPIIISIAGVGTYFAVAVSNSDKNLSANRKQELKIDSNDETFEVFPKIESYDFYDYIRINHGSPEIDDNMIARVAGQVLLKMQFVNGTVDWAYKRINQKTVFLFFKWNPMNGLIPKSHVYKLYLI